MSLYSYYKKVLFCTACSFNGLAHMEYSLLVMLCALLFVVCWAVMVVRYRLNLAHCNQWMNVLPYIHLLSLLFLLLPLKHSLLNFLDVSVLHQPEECFGVDGS